MALIFSMSAQSIEESEETSGGIVTWIAGILYGDDVPLTQEMLDPVSTLVRKTAHMGEYAVLFLLSFATVYFWREGYGKRRSSECWNWDRAKWWLAYAWTVFYAATDEFHQLFTGRGAKVADVAIDAFGALMAVAALFGLSKTIRAAGALRKVGWIAAALACMVFLYVLCFLLFHPEVESIFIV